MMIILGPPGSGKGTQTKILANLTHESYFSAGDTLKVYAKQNSQLDYLIKNGHLIEDDETTAYLINEALNLGTSVIIDGFPRTIKQCRFLCKFLKNKFSGENLNNIIKNIFVLQINKDQIKQRLAIRFICENCHTTYNHSTHCCSILASKRHDDILEETIDRRWQGFTSHINDIKEEFSKYSIQINDINGDAPLQEVTNSILSIREDMKA